MIPSFQQVAVIDASLGCCLALRDTTAEANLAIPRGALPGTFVIAEVMVSLDILRAAPAALHIQPRLF